MVNTASSYDFAALVDGFLAQKKLAKGRHGELIHTTIRRRALDLLEKPDVRYMPAFKILDLLAALANIGGAIADAPQLRPSEIQALLRESMSETAPLIHQFLLDAAIERARYEPLMLEVRASDPSGERDLILNRRWSAMRTAQQEKAKLPDAWMDAVDHAVLTVLTADDFRHFRQGPILQLAAEMLALARKLHQQNAPLTALTDALKSDGALWRRYALKSARYAEKFSATADIRTIEPKSHTLH